MAVRFSITIRQHKSLRNLIEAIPETDWTPIPYCMDGAAAVAETTYTACRTKPLAQFHAVRGILIWKPAGINLSGIRQRLSFRQRKSASQIDGLEGVRLLRQAVHPLPE